MNKTIKNYDDPRALIRRMFYLAYQASDVMGMGMLQQQDGVTEDQVFENVRTRGDYPSTPTQSRQEDMNADYVFGRMMKLRLTEVDSGVEFVDSELRLDYQSWCSTYQSIDALAEAAIRDLAS